jgi:hypothetical protein
MRMVFCAAAGFLMAGASASAAHPDTMCAAVYTVLAESARSHGVEGGNFDSAASTAQDTHLAQYPTEDPQRYSLVVIDTAQSLRDSLSRGVITANALIGTAAGCNRRYFR